MSAPSVHHVGIGVVDEVPILRLFKKQLGFEIISTRKTNSDQKWVLQRNTLKFVITKLNPACDSILPAQNNDKKKKKANNNHQQVQPQQHCFVHCSRSCNLRAASADNGQVLISSASCPLPQIITNVLEPTQGQKKNIESNSFASSTTNNTTILEADHHDDHGTNHGSSDEQHHSDETMIANSRFSWNNCLDNGDGCSNTDISNSSIIYNNYCCASHQSSLPHFSSSLWNKTRDSNDQYCTPSSGHIYSKKSNRNNSVYEVCFEVKDVARSLHQAVECGASVIRPLTTVTSDEGEVTYGIIQSCAGNVQHTIVNTENYFGRFLPSFVDYNDNSMSDEQLTEALSEISLDHITLCVHPGHTLQTISWYQKCFGMHRLIVNRDESYNDGLMLSDIEMRLAAMSYWRCSESGVSLDSSMTSVKFVIVESVSIAPNQVTTFLKNHDGPGVQHIGLLTEKLVDTVRVLKQRQVSFLQPPREYYNEIGKLKEITDCGESVKILEECGILLDSEADCSVENEGSGDEDPMSLYLMQIFTKPLFGDDTFFLELLQRHGAQGFGAGNITALWRAVKLYMQNKEQGITYDNSDMQ